MSLKVKVINNIFAGGGDCERVHQADHNSDKDYEESNYEHKGAHE